MPETIVRKQRLEENIPIAHYGSLSYDSLGRFNSYWHQIEEVARERPDRVLEIGMGNGFVSDYLSRNSFDVVSVDLNTSLRPDVAGEVGRLPFRDRAFDVVLCAKVLEHMVWEEAVSALGELARVAHTRVVLSVPDRRPALRFHVGGSGCGQRDLFLPLPIPAPRRLMGVDHEWELGTLGYPVRRMVKAMREQGLSLERTYRVLRDPSCRFFVATKDA